jgi:hypothetical protein
MVAPVQPFPPAFKFQLRLQFDNICDGQYALTLLDLTSGTPREPAGSRLQQGWVRHLRTHAGHNRSDLLSMRSAVMALAILLSVFANRLLIALGFA